MKKFVLFAAFVAVLGLGFAACGTKPKAPKEAAVEEEAAEITETAPSTSAGEDTTTAENSATK